LNTVPDRYGRTDGQTDRQTDGRLTVALPRSALASRSKKRKKTFLHLCPKPDMANYNYNYN